MIRGEAVLLGVDGISDFNGLTLLLRRSDRHRLRRTCLRQPTCQPCGFVFPTLPGKDPPNHAIVLSVDEKSQIQALDRTQPVPGFVLRWDASSPWRRLAMDELFAG